MVTKVQQIDAQTYRKHVLRARSTRNHFTFSRDYVVKLKMKKMTALFFQDILNLASMEKTKRKEIDGKEYFLCSRKYLNKSLDWEDDAQKTQLDKLKKWGFVDVVRKGLPAKRWVYIDIFAVETALDKGEPLPDSDGGESSRPVGAKIPDKKPKNPRQETEEPPDKVAAQTPDKPSAKTPSKKEHIEERTQKTEVLLAEPTTSNGRLNGKTSKGGTTTIAEALVKEDKRKGRLAEAFALMDEWSNLVWQTFKIKPDYGKDRYVYAGKVKNGIDGIAGGAIKIMEEADWYCKKYLKVKNLPTKITNLLQFIHPNTFGWISGRHMEYEESRKREDGEWNRV